MIFSDSAKMSAYLRKGKEKFQVVFGPAWKFLKAFYGGYYLWQLITRKMFHVRERLATALVDVRIVSWEWGVLTQTV